MINKYLFIICFALAAFALFWALDGTFAKMAEYEAEHGCTFQGFGLCEKYN